VATSEAVSKSSRTWIAGAVVGSLAGIVIIILLLWVLYSRKKRRHGSPTTQSLIPEGCVNGQAAYAKPQLGYGDTGHEAYKHQHEVHEMHATHLSQAIHEMPGAEYTGLK
jgi:hypothetical protein